MLIIIDVKDNPRIIDNVIEHLEECDDIKFTKWGNYQTNMCDYNIQLLEYISSNDMFDELIERVCDPMHIYVLNSIRGDLIERGEL